MKKLFMVIILMISLFLNANVFASEIVVTEPENVTVKYFRTTTITNNNSIMSMGNSPVSYTEEITEEEYNSASVNQTVIVNGNVTIENSYEKLTTSISTIGSYYRYNVDLEWKTIPSTRSYDTIAIGFPSSVKKLGGLYFEQTYCTSASNCNTSTSYLYSYSSTNGVGVTFQQPSGSLYSLNHHMHFNVTKNTTAIITSQHAYGDFAHAISSVSLTNAKKYSVDTYGIAFQSGVSSYYDNIDVAEATWYGTW